MDAIFLKTKIKSHVLTNDFLKVQKTFKETRDTTVGILPQENTLKQPLVFIVILCC